MSGKTGKKSREKPHRFKMGKRGKGWILSFIILCKIGKEEGMISKESGPL